MKASFQHRLRLIWILTGLALMLCIAFISKDTEPLSPTESEHLLEEDFRKSLDLVSTANSPISKVEINQSKGLIHDIFLFENDSLILWNNHHDDIENLGNDPYFTITGKDSLNDRHYIIGLRSGDHTRLDYHISSLDEQTILSPVGATDESGFMYLSLFILLLFTVISYEWIKSKLLSDATRYILSTLGNLLLSLVIYHIFYNHAYVPFTSISLILFSLFIYYFTQGLEHHIEGIQYKKYLSSIASISSIYLLIIGLCYSGYYIFTKSNIYQLETTAIQYSLRGIVFIMAMIFGLFSVFYYSLTIVRTYIHRSDITEKYGYGLLSIVLISLAAMTISQLPIVGIAGFSIAYLLILEIYIESGKKRLIFTFWWVLIFSVALALLLSYFIIKKDITDRSIYTELLYHHNSEKSDALISQLDKNLSESRVFEPISDLPAPAKLQKNDYQDFITQELNKNDGLFNHLNLSILGYDPEGKAIFSNQYLSHTDIIRRITYSKRISNNTFYNPYDNKYFILYPVDNENYSDPLEIYIEVTDTRYAKKISDALQYVIVENGAVVKSNISSEDFVPVSKIYNINQTQDIGYYTYVVTNPEPNIKIVSFKKTAGLVKPISLFSFILTLSGFIIILCLIINTYTGFLPKDLSLELTSKSSLRNKIQLAIITLTIASFIIIGVVTTYYFRNVLAKSELLNDQKETITVLNNIKSTIESANTNDQARFIIENRLHELSNNHNVNIAAYDLEGHLIGSSQDQRYLRLPMDKLNLIKSNLTAEIKTTEYQSTIVPLYHHSEDPYAALSIAKPNSKILNQSIIDFLSTILNVYVFLFLTAAALAIGISNSITKPLSILADKLRDFKLGRRNERLEWNSTDEIGALIQDYNNLTQQLQDSADIIAKTQRDMAWREMAKQVAHEIKNPLTPMKLSIQYLQKKIKEDPENAPALMERISSTLIEQINNLSQISDEFSNFAKMPKAENEKVILNEVVESIHDLFRKREDLDINLSIPIDNIFVYADRNHLVRILNNLVKNAIQAIPTDRKGKIDIRLYRQLNNAVISVEDNGTGIPEHMRKKVFEPNFTTKSSGTGLGLAISANMLDSFNGKIYFETADDIGTTFYVEIPLMRLEDNFEGKRIVSLD